MEHFKQVILYRIRLVLHKIFISKTGTCARRYLWEDVKKIINKESPVIVDGGSNRGDFIRMFLRKYTSPVIYAFEAHPGLAQELKDKFKGNDLVKIISKGLGSSSNSLIFNLAKNKNSSSFLERGEDNIKHQGDSTSTAGKVTVPIVRLDEELKGIDIDVLKLDIEGYELEALKGAENILSKIKIIVSEVEFCDLYKNAPHFSELELFLRSKGFRLLNLYNLSTHEDMTLTMGDALFLNEKYF